MKLCSCLLESMYCLKKCPGVHPTFDKYYYSVPSRKNTISAEYARCPQHNYNIPIPANKCSIQNKHTLLNKTNLPLGQCSVFLQGQYPNKIWRIPWTVAPCPLKECNVHFQMSNPPLKGAVSLWKKIIFLHNTCSIIDIEHPFQSAMCLKLWALSKSALSLLTTEQQNIDLYGKKYSCEEAAFLENWITCVWHVYSSPWSDQPSLHLDNSDSHLKTCFQYYPTIMY